jgi:hypothetical protein
MEDFLPTFYHTYVKGTAQVEAVEKTLVKRDKLLREVRDRLLKAQHRMK